MSHSTADGRMLLHDDTYLDINKELVEPFDGNKCPALAGKPKVFLFQHCQGKEGATARAGRTNRDSILPLDDITPPNSAKPRESSSKADIAIIHSTYQGKMAT